MNWKSLIDDLVAAGFSYGRIAQETGIKSRSSVFELRSGKNTDILYTAGKALEALHAVTMKRKAAGLPEPAKKRGGRKAKTATLQDKK